MRQSGYYWVKYNGEWEVAEYFESWNNWNQCGVLQDYEDSDFEEIDERRIER